MPAIYLLRQGDSNTYKIGRTTQETEERKNSLQTGNPSVLTVVKEWAVSHKVAELEKYLHDVFADNRRWGSPAKEFFEFPDIAATIATISALVDTHDDIDAPASAGIGEPLDVEATDKGFTLYKERQLINSRMNRLKYHRDRLDRQLKQTIRGRRGLRLHTKNSCTDLVRWEERMSHRFDVTRFKIEQPELYADYVKETLTTYFTYH
jgi:hypothetical protein